MNSVKPVGKMRSQAVGFDAAQQSLRRLGLPGALPTLHSVGVNISRSVLGGSHSVAVYPPIDSLTPIDALSITNSINFCRDTSLYVHIAFCETRCTFCHYAVQHYSGVGSSSQTANDSVAQYMEALERELVIWGAKLKESATVVSSIYIGGGTPLVLEMKSLGNLIRIIKKEFSVLPGAEICIEGSPLTISASGGEDKLRFLKEEGVTRLSFGAQSFDNAVLKYAARGYDRELPIRASQIASEVFDNWNIDLIQGLFKGSPYETWGNLQVISQLRPPHLTWYHARFADRPQGDWYKAASKRPEFEDEPATLLGRMLIWQEMAELGYHQVDGNRFVRDQRFVDPFKLIRTSASRNLLGVGAGSYSHVGEVSGVEGGAGYVFRNESSIPAYVKRVLCGTSPIATGRLIDGAELLATSYATGLRNGRIENASIRAIRVTVPNLSSHYERLVATLCDVGILESYSQKEGGGGLRFSELGRLFEDETLALFFSPAVQKELATKSIFRSAKVVTLG